VLPVLAVALFLAWWLGLFAVINSPTRPGGDHRDVPGVGRGRGRRSGNCRPAAGLLMVVLLIGWPAVALLAWLRCRFVAAAASTVVVGHRGGPARTVAGPVSAVVSTHAGFRDLPSGTCVAGVGGQDAPRPNVPASYGLTSTTATLLVGAMVAAGAIVTPGKVVKTFPPENQEHLAKWALKYVEVSRGFKDRGLS
jgi:hypothetical protein